MSLSWVTRTLESLHDKEVQERRKKYAKRKSIPVLFSRRRNSLSDYYEHSKHLNFIGTFTTSLDAPDVRSRFIRKVISTLSSIDQRQVCEAKISFDQGFVSVDSIEQTDCISCIHVKYALKDVCDFGLELSNSLTMSVFFFAVLDTLKPIALCHVFTGEEETDLRRMYRCFQDRVSLR